AVATVANWRTSVAFRAASCGHLPGLLSVQLASEELAHVLGGCAVIRTRRLGQARGNLFGDAQGNFVPQASASCRHGDGTLNTPSALVYGSAGSGVTKAQMAVSVICAWGAGMTRT